MPAHGRSPLAKPIAGRRPMVSSEMVTGQRSAQACLRHPRARCTRCAPRMPARIVSAPRCRREGVPSPWLAADGRASVHRRSRAPSPDPAEAEAWRGRHDGGAQPSRSPWPHGSARSRRRASRRVPWRCLRQAPGGPAVRLGGRRVGHPSSVLGSHLGWAVHGSHGQDVLRARLWTRPRSGCREEMESQISRPLHQVYHLIRAHWRSEGCACIPSHCQILFPAGVSTALQGGGL